MYNISCIHNHFYNVIHFLPSLLMQNSTEEISTRDPFALLVIIISLINPLGKKKIYVNNYCHRLLIKRLSLVNLLRNNRSRKYAL